MKQCTIRNESVSISSRDILTEILRQGTQEMLAQAINNEVEVAEYICLNHPRLKARGEQVTAFGEVVFTSSPLSRSQMVSRTESDGFAESGFGGWVNEKSRSAGQVLLLLGRRKSHPQHLTVSHPDFTIPIMGWRGHRTEFINHVQQMLAEEDIE